MSLVKTVEYSIKINNRWLCWLKHKLTLDIDPAQCMIYSYLQNTITFSFSFSDVSQFSLVEYNCK